jgi:hypothetical protein
MRKLLSIFALLPAVAAAGTRIVDTIKYPDGTLASGKAEIALFTPFITAGNEAIGAAKQTVTITGGVIDVTLEPNDTATPSGTSYAVRFYLSRGSYLQYWIVPTSASTLKIKDVAVATVPSPALLVKLTQLDPGGANTNDVLRWSGTAWAPAAPSGTGITSINSQTGATQTIDNLDGHIAVTSAANTHRLAFASASRLPSPGEKEALAGTSGTPSAANRYVTDSDPRNSNARPPAAHASTHRHGGSDEIAAAAPGANAIPKAGANGRLAAGFAPLLVDAADQGYFFPVTIQAPQSSGATTAFSANTMRLWQFVLPFAATVNQMSFEVVGTSGAGTSLGLGIWDASCSTLLVNSGVMTAGGTPDINVAGVKTKTISGGPVTLNPGVYWLAMTTDSTTLTLRSTSLPSQVITMLNAQTNKKFAQAGNNGSAGSFPAACGALAVAAANQPPIVLFER